MARILKFVSRAEQLRLRGLRNFSQWQTDNGEPLTPRERIALVQRKVDDERDDQQRALRHGPRPGGGIVLSIVIEPLLRPIASRKARERIASARI